jgi:arginyl-tRNA synthetase
MKEKIISLLEKQGLKKEEIEKLLEVPPASELGDYAFPCFSLASMMKKNPVLIAKELAAKLKNKAGSSKDEGNRDIEKIEANGAYLNFFLNKRNLSSLVLEKVLKEKEKYGSSEIGKGKTAVIDLSSPNIAKPFGIGHLRSTIIGNSLSEIFSFLNYKVIKINYLGDWGTQFGRMIVGFKKFGDSKKLEKDPINHMLEIYVKASQEEYEEEARNEFKKLEQGDKENLALWKKFRELSLKDFDEIYKILNIKFDVTSGESFYNEKIKDTIKELKDKKLLEKSQGAWVVNLDKYDLGMCLIQKSDEASLYASRDITAALDRHKKYKFSKMIYEVGAEQSLHFKQVFKVLELMGYDWAKNLVHVSHGLYLGKDGKKFSTRKGKTIFMKQILKETIELAKETIEKKNPGLKNKEETARKIAIAAIFYGDLKAHRTNDVVFDIEKFLEFEGNTGPYLLYTYARASSILRKIKKKIEKVEIYNINADESEIVKEIERFPEIVKQAYNELSPNVIANYSYELARKFNEFYHSSQVLGDKNENFRLAVVECLKIVLKQALKLLGIEAIEEM